MGLDQVFNKNRGVRCVQIGVKADFLESGVIDGQVSPSRIKISMTRRVSMYRIIPEYL